MASKPDSLSQTHRLHSRGATSIVKLEDEDYVIRFSWKKLLKFLGPGLLMSIAYVDPGNLESDLQTGATTGYVLLWLLLLTTGMGLVVQLQAAKLGVVTGKHLAEHCRDQYPPLARYSLWIMAEIALIGSDIQEVVGSAIALSLLTGGRMPLWGGVLVTALDSFALLFIEKLGVRYLEAFFGFLISVMVVTFGIMYVDAKVPAAEVWEGFTWPRLPAKDVPTAVALMGSLIMPHNIYLHSALVQTRKLLATTPQHKREALLYFGIESALSLTAAIFINLFVVAVFARAFYDPAQTSITGGIEIGLQTAGKYLGEVYGPAVVIIWGLGLLAAGQASTMTGTYTGQFVMSGFLRLRISPWARITLTRAVAIAPTLAVALIYRGQDNRLDQLNQSLNLLQSCQLPFALIPVLAFTSTPHIMGRHFTNSWLTTLVACGIAAVVIGINMVAVREVAITMLDSSGWAMVGVGVLILLYLVFVGYLIFHGWMTATGRRKVEVPLESRPETGVVGDDDDGAGGAAVEAETTPALHNQTHWPSHHFDDDGTDLDMHNPAAEAHTDGQQQQQQRSWMAWAKQRVIKGKGRSTRLSSSSGSGDEGAPGGLRQPLLADNGSGAGEAVAAVVPAGQQQQQGGDTTAAGTAVAAVESKAVAQSARPGVKAEVVV